eukprot:gene31819-41295_t
MVASYSLPSRSTRGQRVAELVGEAADADAVFWGVNHEIWKEDNEESDDDSYEMEAEKADVFDSDFNDSESDDEDGSDDEKEAKRSQKKETAANSEKSKNKYKEPVKPPRKPPRASSSEPEDPKIKRQRLSDLGADRSRRETTQQKTSSTNEAWKKQSSEKLKLKTTPRTIKTVFNQKDLLLEALDTEETNAKWLKKQELLRDEKIESEKSSFTHLNTEQYIKFSSKRGCLNTITFTSADSMPPIFSKPMKPPVVELKLCAITGLPAKYKDPKTNMYYANVKAFKEIPSKMETSLASNSARNPGPSIPSSGSLKHLAVVVFQINALSKLKFYDDGQMMVLKCK